MASGLLNGFAGSGSGAGVTSVTGTSHRVTASSPDGDVILTTPQDLHSGAAVAFLTLLLNGDVKLIRSAANTLKVVSAAGASIGKLDVAEVQVAGVKAVGVKAAAVASPTGGAVQDAEARAAIDAIRSRLSVDHGLIAT